LYTLYKIYENMGLDKIDAALHEGLPNWDLEREEIDGSAGADDADRASGTSSQTESVSASHRMKSFYSTLKRKKLS